MDLNALVDIISQVGFPIACCVILFKQNSDLQKTLNDISTTMTVLSERITDIENKINGSK